MAEQYTLQTRHNPTVFNKDMLLGGLIGSYITPIVGTAVGAAIGGFIGKRRQANENEHGKVVGEPSFWNKDTLIGGLIGNAVGGIAAGLSFLGITGVGIGASEAALAALAPATLATGLGVALAVGVAVTVAGVYLGGQMGKARETREFEQARRETITNSIGKDHSPTVAQAVEYAMEHDKSKNWAQQIENERAQAQTQEQQR